MYDMSNVRSGDSEINKTAHNMPISRGILKRSTLCRTKLQVKVHGCGNCSTVSNARACNKVSYILGLREIIALGRMQDLNS
jgi:hypothetical protein